MSCLKLNKMHYYYYCCLLFNCMVFYGPGLYWKTSEFDQAAAYIFAMSICLIKLYRGNIFLNSQKTLILKHSKSDILHNSGDGFKHITKLGNVVIIEFTLHFSKLLSISALTLISFNSIVQFVLLPHSSVG